MSSMKPMSAKKTLVLARKHVANGAPMASSAALCIADAQTLLDAGFEKMAKNRALKALAYSVGIWHEDYMRAAGVVPTKHEQKTLCKTV